VFKKYVDKTEKRNTIMLACRKSNIPSPKKLAEREKEAM
jgi:hypothetical protein